MKSLLIFLTIFYMLVGTSCYYDNKEFVYPQTNVDCNTINAKYADVSAIMTTRCATAGCHNSASAAGGTVLESYNQVKAKVAVINQRVIVAGNMPPGVPLTSNELATLKCWINAGAPQ